MVGGEFQRAPVGCLGLRVRIGLFELLARARTIRRHHRVRGTARARARAAGRRPRRAPARPRSPSAAGLTRPPIGWSPLRTAMSLPTAVMRSPVERQFLGSAALSRLSERRILRGGMLRRLQALGGAQQHHVLEGEAVLVARAARGLHEAGVDEAREDRARKAQHLADAAQRCRALPASCLRHFLARTRAGAASPSPSARGARPCVHGLGRAARAAGAPWPRSAARRGSAARPWRAGLAFLLALREAGAQRIHQVDHLAAGGGSACSVATICLPAIFSSMAARIRFFSSSSNCGRVVAVLRDLLDELQRQIQLAVGHR